MNRFSSQQQQLCRDEPTRSVLQQLWQAGDDGRTHDRLGECALSCETLLKEGLIIRPDDVWQLSGSGRELWYQWNQEQGVVVHPYGTVVKQRPQRQVEQLPTNHVAKPSPAQLREKQRLTPPAGFSIDTAATYVQRHGYMRSMLYRLGNEPSRNTLKSTFAVADTDASLIAERARSVTTILKLELLGLIDDQFRLTDSGKAALDRMGDGVREQMRQEALGGR